MTYYWPLMSDIRCPVGSSVGGLMVILPLKAQSHLRIVFEISASYKSPVTADQNGSAISEDNFTHRKNFSSTSYRIETAFRVLLASEYMVHNPAISSKMEEPRRVYRVSVSCTPLLATRETRFLFHQEAPPLDSTQWLLQSRVSKLGVFDSFERNHLYHSDRQLLEIHLMRKSQKRF
ncbi:hypothetical protein Y032_0134g1820 [Ancylostoma ceylanicum]|uniref:Uncharacterized protein n=1 Tax=Ancylostoma ceylanicum TaxID=53326 RepID=A0A016T613_9BILA|nr:hypothetical protein Y032_0134g1820 [Ancylostoma ceylanicum]